MIEAADKIYTVEEYLELEKTSEVRHEFVYGKLIPMSGESKDANDIALNCAIFLRQALLPKGFKVFVQSVKVQVDEQGLYRYPDVVVTPKSDDADTHIVMQPKLLIEVTSENSAARDRVTKLREYARMESLQHYLIIDQYEMLVEFYNRDGEKWIYEIFSEPEDTVELTEFDLSLSLADIYAGIEFKEEKE